MQYYNRAISWLDFNERVLQEAQDRSVPLMQRLRFLGIFSNNQDEFVRVRVAYLARLAELKNIRFSKEYAGYTAKETLGMVRHRMAASQKLFAQTYKTILTEMAETGIHVLSEKELSPQQQLFCREYFSRVVSVRLVPLMLRRSSPLPPLKDGLIYHAVCMTNKKGSQSRYAVIRIPVSNQCPRFVALPSEPGRTDIIFLDDVIRLCLDEVFFMFNYHTISAHSFKVVRDAQITMEDDISKSLMEKMERSIKKRELGLPVKLTYDSSMPEPLLKLLSSKLHLTKRTEFDSGGRYHLMRDLVKFPAVRPELEELFPDSMSHPEIAPLSSLFKTISKKDLCLHYPYHRFSHTIDFLREAAIDPKVERIAITLYRTAERSKVINALINAARNGKKVFVLMELQARFDEEQNIQDAALLQEEGVRVVDGVPGLKVHSKLILVQRRERGSLKGYAYVGTGNFNESTARIYSDFGLFTCDEQIVQDMQQVFDYLVFHRPFNTKRLLVAPFSMRPRFERLIAREIQNATEGKKARIRAKFNSLTDADMIRRLYQASESGVDVQLIVRGACCLCPEIEKLSSRIRAISIVDKYLEHARLVVFHNGGAEQVFLLSADWMTRNLDRRIEVGVPVLNAAISRSLIDVFETQWSDNVKARTLSTPGANTYQARGAESRRSQLMLFDYYAQSRSDAAR